MPQNLICIRSLKLLFVVAASVACALPAFVSAQSAQTVQTTEPRKKILTRVFWQDNANQKLSYADIATTDKWFIDRGWVSGFPEVDAATSALGQMQSAGTNVMVAIADKGNEANSKQVSIDSGAFQRPHGNHFHWMYTNKPSTTSITAGSTSINPMPNMPSPQQARQLIGNALQVDASEMQPGKDYVMESQWMLLANPVAGEASLTMIHANSQPPAVLRLPIPTAEGLSLSGPKTKLSVGKRYAFLFQERVDPASDIKEQLVVVELDPNRDMNFSDARVFRTIPIDASKISGGRGHHNICFDAYGRFAVFTNPGDGLLSVMTLNDMQVRVRFRVGGTPDRIVAVGAPEHFH